MKPTINERLLLLLKAVGGRAANPDVYEKGKGVNLVVKGYWQRLEAQTGVKSSKWRLLASGKQKVTPELIEAAARLWPQYAFWLATGITDVANGHTAPETATIFPEYSHADDPNSNSYFDLSIRLQEKILEGTRTTAALDRTYVLGTWIGGKALENAYSFCESDDYKKLRRIWDEREKLRETHKGYLTGVRRPWLVKKKLDPSNQMIESEKMTNPLTAHQDQWDLFYEPKPKS